MKIQITSCNNCPFFGTIRNVHALEYYPKCKITNGPKFNGIILSEEDIKELPIHRDCPLRQDSMTITI